MVQGEILKRLIKASGLTQEEFALKLGVTRATVNNLTKQAAISDDYILKTCRALKVSHNVFTKSKRLTTNEVMQLVNEPPATERTEAAVLTPFNTILYVPVEAEAGFAGGYTSPVYNQDLQPWSLPGFDEPGYSFRIKGDSMFPTFKEGEIVITGVKTEPYEMIKKEYVYVVVTADNILIKRVVADKKESGRLTLISDNPAYEKTQLFYDDVKLYRARRNIQWDLSKKYG